MKNWKTTAWGVAAISGMVISAAVQWHNGQHVDWASLFDKIGAAASGIGLISAADAGLLAKFLPGGKTEDPK